MLKDKVIALVKSLPQRPRSRLRAAARVRRRHSSSRTPFAGGGLLDALLQAVRDTTQLDVKRADFKLEQLPPHLFMNLRVVDEHGRQLGMGRNLAALKAELGGQARSAFQALAELKVAAAAGAPQPQPSPASGSGGESAAVRLPLPRAGEGRR